jgi:hypothetical protein
MARHGTYGIPAARENPVTLYPGRTEAGLVFQSGWQSSTGARGKANAEMKINSVEKRKQRMDLKQLAKPRSGVDDPKAKFGRPTTDIPGVVDQKNIPPGK